MELSNAQWAMLLDGIDLERSDLKNWILLGSEEAGPKVAGIISIIETCLRLDIRPRDYLKGILTEVADRLKRGIKDLSDLTPMAWKTRRAS